ncbi:MAG: histidine phosphatase family protein, partial [Acidobacteriota bacterium]|nr:histidine phosphatase family protein [Acidobacteriota bacterium]
MIATAIVLAASLASGPVLALDFIYVVRHAEKVDYWPPERSISAYRPLSEEGVARAERLAEFLEEKGVAAIYTSSTTRALATGLPLAERTGASLIAD